MQGRGLLSFSLSFSFSSRSGEIDEESYHGGNEKQREGESKRERGERKIRSQAHGYTALLVNTMLRKHHGVVQRGHDVSIPKLSSRPPWRVHGEHALLRLSLRLFLADRCRLSLLCGCTLSCSPLRKSVQDVRERGTTHRASQITPLSESPDLLASVYTVQRSHHCSYGERLPSFCPLFLYSVVSTSSSASERQPLLSALRLWLLGSSSAPSFFRSLRGLSRDTGSFVSLSFLHQ